MQVTKQLIDEFESFCQSIGKPQLLCGFDFKSNKYRPKKCLVSMDYSSALRMCYSLNFGLEVWLKQREKMAADIDEVACTNENGDKIVFVEDLPDWVQQAIQTSQPQEQGE